MHVVKLAISRCDIPILNIRISCWLRHVENNAHGLAQIQFNQLQITIILIYITLRVYNVTLLSGVQAHKYNTSHS